MLEGIGPPKFRVPTSNGVEGVIEVGDGGDVPGVTSQGARVETTCVVGEVGNNLLDDLVGKPGDGGRAHRGGLTRRGTPRSHPLDLGFASVPSLVDEQLDRCGGGGTGHDQMDG